MQNQKRILTLLISGASLLPLALHAVEKECTTGVPCCYPLPSKEGSGYPLSPVPIDFPNREDFPEQYLLVNPAIHLEPISTCRVGLYNTKGSEIVAYDPQTRRLFVVNQAQEVETPSPTLDVIDIRDPSSPRYEGSIDLSTSYEGDSNVSRVLPTSVAVRNGIVAVAVHPDPDPTIKEGRVLLYKANQLQWPRNIEVGFTPDMLTFTPNGQTVLVANTGSPPAVAGPPTAVGSVSLIDIDRGVERATVSTVDFSAFNDDKGGLRDAGVRIYKGEYGDWSVSQSLQPEYIAVANNSLKAWISLEVNNALAVLDIKKGQVTAILPLGVKDHNSPTSGFVSWDGGESSNGFDASDSDGKINITQWPVLGMYQPDAMEAYQTLGRTYLVTANEGTYFKFDNKNNGPDERVKVGDKKVKLDSALDPYPFPDDPRSLKQVYNLGRLRVSNWQGDTEGDGDYDALYAFSSRSFSIWSEEGKLIFDSGDDFERIQEQVLPNYFNCDDNSNVFDDKSDDQGVQPDGLTIGKLYGRYYVFVVLQRVGGIMVYDITDPKNPRFQQYINNRNFEIDPNEEIDHETKETLCTDGKSDEGECAKAGDLGPEGVLFISEADSPTKEPLLVVTNQTSSSTTVYRIERILPPPR